MDLVPGIIMNHFSIGNDLVAIKEFQVVNPQRFAGRVMAREELDKLCGKYQCLAEYWAAKEAAFKALKRLNSKLVFTPRRFVYDPVRGKVVYHRQQLNCEVRSRTNYIAACAYCGTRPEHLRTMHWVSTVQKEARFVSAVKGLSESQAVRLLARRKIAELTGVAKERLCIVPDAQDKDPHPRGQYPQLILDGSVSGYLLSFSHDGGYLYCSCAFCDQIQ